MGVKLPHHNNTVLYREFVLISTTILQLIYVLYFTLILPSFLHYILLNDVLPLKFFNQISCAFSVFLTRATFPPILPQFPWTPERHLLSSNPLIMQFMSNVMTVFHSACFPISAVTSGCIQPRSCALPFSVNPNASENLLTCKRPPNNANIGSVVCVKTGKGM